jgi:hypothetical protein
MRRLIVLLVVQLLLLAVPWGLALAQVATPTPTSPISQPVPVAPNTPAGVPVGFTNLQMWDLIVGFLAPLLVSVIIQSHWDARAQTACAALVSIALAAVTVYLQGSFSPQDFISSALIIGVTAINVYHHFWSNTGVTQNLEVATNWFGKKAPVPLPETPGIPPADTGTMPQRR